MEGGATRENSLDWSQSSVVWNLLPRSPVEKAWGNRATPRALSIPCVHILVSKHHCPELLGVMAHSGRVKIFRNSLC